MGSRTNTQHIPILKIAIESEQNVVDARQRTRQIAAGLGLENQDQVRVATAVSELARNAYQYAHGGTVEFSFNQTSKPQMLLISVADKGKGIKNLDVIFSGQYVSNTGMGVGLVGAKKLSDWFDIESSAEGTRITIGKNIAAKKPISPPDLAQLGETLHRERPQTPVQEVQRQNTELMQTLEQLRSRQDDLSLLNQELNETNRGVVALYAELDEKASSIQKANEVKTNFLSNMTHEFRTPLTSIISLTRLLTERIDGDLTSEQERQVMYIRKSAEGLLEIVGDLLDLAKVEAGRITLKIDEVEVNDILGTLRGVFRPLLAVDSPVDFIVDMRAQIPKLISDEGKIAQILRNLVSNALKFTERGTVTAEAELTDLDTVLFRIRDTGIGISPDDLERVFEDFSQVESKLQRQTRGTGLGLPLSRKLARLLGGDVWVTSQVGVGSVFHLEIPRVFTGETDVQLVHQTKPEIVHPQAKEKREPTVLLIDDDETSRYVLKNLLRGFINVKTLECDAPTCAVDLAEKNLPSLIFLDLNMPGLNGFDLLRDLKSNEATATIPVVINTAKILNSDETDFLQQLSVGILSKERSNVTRANSELRDALVKAGLLTPETSH